MKVIIKGSMSVNEFAEKLLEVANSTALRMEQENEGVTINGYEIHEAEVTVKFLVEGVDEPHEFHTH